GAWDDGGIAGACHVATYPLVAYDDPGCPTGSYAAAEDSAVGDSVEIGVGCDVSHTAGGNAGGPDFGGAATCVANLVVLNQNPGAIGPCVVPQVNCVTSPATCINAPTTACGADGSTDFIAFGE